MNKSITLASGESKEVVFEITPDVAGTYHVQLDGLSGSFIVYELAADFEVSNLIINPNEVEIGETVTISCQVTNVGGKIGSKTITLEVT